MQWKTEPDGLFITRDRLAANAAFSPRTRSENTERAYCADTRLRLPVLRWACADDIRDVTPRDGQHRFGGDGQSLSAKCNWLHQLETATGFDWATSANWRTRQMN